jgi:hypothetical protein
VNPFVTYKFCGSSRIGVRSQNPGRIQLKIGMGFIDGIDKRPDAWTHSSCQSLGLVTLTSSGPNAFCISFLSRTLQIKPRTL